MSDDQLLERYRAAFETFKACREREKKAYGDEYDRVKLMEHEAPAPDPCVEAYNDMITSLLGFSGELSGVDMGEYREEIMRGVQKGR